LNLSFFFAQQNHLARLPGVGARVTLAQQDLMNEAAAPLESITLVKATATLPAVSRETLHLQQLPALLPHLEVLVLDGCDVRGDLGMLAALQKSLRRVVMRQCSGISGAS